MAAVSTPALAALDAAGVRYVVHAYAHAQGETRYGLEAASQLAASGAEVLKTLIVTTANGLVVVVIPVASRLDLKAVASVRGIKQARFAERRDAERVSGYLAGGISPFGQKRRLPTIVDAEVNLHRAVIVSAGRRGLAVEIAAADLISVTGAAIAPIGRV